MSTAAAHRPFACVPYVDVGVTGRGPLPTPRAAPPLRPGAPYARPCAALRGRRWVCDLTGTGNKAPLQGLSGPFTGGGHIQASAAPQADVHTWPPTLAAQEAAALRRYEREVARLDRLLPF